MDRDKRRESAEKLKSAKDLEKKKEKKKNLARQALETRRAKSRQRGEPEEESPDEDDGGDGDDDSDDSEGMASRLDRILKGPPQTGVDVPQAGDPKGALSGSRESQQRESSPRRSRADTPLEPAQGRTIPRPQPPPASKAGHRVKSLAMGPLTRGRAASSSKRETGRRSTSPGAGQAGPGALTRGGSRPAVEAQVGGSLFLWGKIFDVVILTFRCLCIFSGNGFSYAYSSFLRLKRPLEQAQPSIAKKLKVGAASKDSG